MVRWGHNFPKLPSAKASSLREDAAVSPQELALSVARGECAAQQRGVWPACHYPLPITYRVYYTKIMCVCVPEFGKDHTSSNILATILPVGIYSMSK